MHLTSSGSRSVALAVGVLVALLVTPPSALAQAVEPSESPDAAIVTEAPEAVPMAKVRFLHGSHAGLLEFQIDDTSMVEDLDMGQVSEYMDIPAGAHVVSIKAAGPGGAELDRSKLKLKANTLTTIVGNDGVHDSSVTEVRVLTDKPKPVVGRTQLRIVDLCSNCSGVDVMTDTSKKKPMAKKLGFPKATKYMKVAPGELDLMVRPGDTNQQTWDLDPITLEPNSANTLFLVRWVIDGTFLPVVAVDAAASSLLALNASREGPALDVYVDGKLATKKLAPGQAGKSMKALSGEHLVQVVEAGTDPADGSLAEGQVTLEPGALAMIVGVGSSLEAVAAPMTKARAAKTPQIRFVHADADTPTVDIDLQDLDLIEGLAFGDMTEYVTLPGDSSYFWIRPNDGSGGPFHEAPLDLGPGNYTAYLGGSANDATVEFVIVRDAVAKKK